jgi:hypothetical protein
VTDLTKPALRRRELKAYKLPELLSLPSPEYLIEGIIQKNSFSMLYGAPGHGKTFVALDMALHIATGRPWCDKTVQHGQVIYIAAEGYMSVLDRIRAWCTFYRASPPEDFLMVIDPIDLTGGDKSLEEFLVHIVGSADTEHVLRDEDGEVTETLSAPPVQLVIFDTLARCATGADENSAQDMGNIVRWLDKLRDKDLTGLDTAVMVLHHSAKHFAHERGSSALRGAADTMMYVAKDDTGPILKCSKQKSAENFEPIDFALAQLPDKNAVLIQREKIDLIMPERIGAPAKAMRSVRLGPVQMRCLRAIAENAGPEGMTPVEMSRYINADMPQTVRVKTALVRYGYILNDPGTRNFKLTRAGLRALQDNTENPLMLEVVDGRGD